MIGHESKSSFSCVWSARGIRVLAHGISGRLCAILSAGQTRATGLSPMREPGSEPEGAALPRVADCPHWPQAGVPGDGSAQMPMPKVWPELRGVPPFAPAYVSYTHRLQAFIEDLRGMM